MKDNFDTDIDSIKFENKAENDKTKYKVIDRNIKESFSIKELLSERELKKLKWLI